MKFLNTFKIPIPFPHTPKVPPDSILEVIIGCRADEKKRGSIINLINSNDKLNHVTVKQAVINDNHYKIDIEKITC